MDKRIFPTRISISSNAASGALLQKFVAEILEAENLLADPGLVVYRLPDGTIIEIHKKDAFHQQEIFGRGKTVMSFPVCDIEASVARMLTAGAKTIDGIVRLDKAYAYCHLMLGNEQVVGLYQIDHPPPI